MIKNLPRCILAVITSLLAFGSLNCQTVNLPSYIKNAAIRMRIEPEKGALTKKPRVGIVEISPLFQKYELFGIFTEEGDPVAQETVWSANGEPTLIRFDISQGSKAYYLCFDSHFLPPSPNNWIPQAGVVVETQPCTKPNRKARGDLPELIKDVGKTEGRDYVSEVRSGTNPFGNSSNYMATYRGWFNVTQEGDYSFATISEGPSFVFVDETKVTDWQGEHSSRKGRNGQHSGDIHLTPGPHCLKYIEFHYNEKNGAEVAWCTPAMKDFTLMKESDFLPVARFHPVSFTSNDPAQQLYFESQTIDQCALGDSMVMRLSFQVIDPLKTRQYLWRFEDGSTASGTKVTHIFARQGIAQITLEASEQEKPLISTTAHLRIAPNWLQKEWWNEKHFAMMKKELMCLDLSVAPAADLRAFATFAEKVHDRTLQMQWGEVMVRRSKDFSSPEDGLFFYKLGIAALHQGEAGNELAKKSFQFALEPERKSKEIVDKANLRLAEILINGEGDGEAGEKTLKQVAIPRLSPEDARLLKLLSGDAFLVRGQIENAKKMYLAIGQKTNGAIADVKRSALLESVSHLIENKQWDEAWKQIDQLTQEFPLERMSVAMGLMNVDLAFKQNEFHRAFTTCQWLILVGKEDLLMPRILYNAVEAAFAIGKETEARQAFARLLKEFPYSESAAKAKNKWPL